VPVLFGDGTRMFERDTDGRIQLEVAGVLDTTWPPTSAAAS
jgi:hypothetical protein